MISPHQNTKQVRLAHAALLAALADKTDTAIRYIQRINDECGGSGIYVAMLAWIDAYADHATDGKPPRGKARMAFIQEDTGQLDQDDSDRLPPEVRWAGQLAASRVALDQDRFNELIAEMPKEGAEIGLYVATLLQAVAHTINGLPRGFARMGAS